MAEQLVSVYNDTRGYGACRSCSAGLVWYQTTNGKAMPFNRSPEPVPRKSEHDEGRRLIVFLSADDVHWRTCPYADTFRKKR